ncbi:MAG: hypothetical protein ABWW70_05235, partial [Thermoproteota archaeon]
MVRRKVLLALAALIAFSAALLPLAVGGVSVVDSSLVYTGRSIGIYATLRNSGLSEKCIVGAELAEPVEQVKVELHSVVE